MADVVRIRVRGRSMLPSLADGDELDVTLGAPVTRGDVVLFMDGDVPILHRVLSIRGSRVLTQGDGAPRPDAPFAATRILGVASVARRPMFALRRLLAEHARISIRTILGRRAIAWLRVVRSFTIFLVLASSSAGLFVAAASGVEEPSSPPDKFGLDLQIDNLTDVVRSLPEGELKPIRMIQLADTYRERAAFHQGAAEAEKERWWSEHKDEVERANRGEIVFACPRFASDLLADSVLKKGIAILDYVVKKYPSHARSELALEQLLLSYLDLQEQEKATSILPKLEARDPSSAPLARSYVAIAERNFANKRPQEALVYYEKAAAIAEPDLKQKAERRAEECRAATAHSPAGPQP